MTKKPDPDKILIVEDNGRPADSLRQMIDYFGLETEIASDGGKATKLLKENERESRFWECETSDFGSHIR